MQIFQSIVTKDMKVKVENESLMEVKVLVT